MLDINKRILTFSLGSIAISSVAVGISLSISLSASKNNDVDSTKILKEKFHKVILAESKADSIKETSFLFGLNYFSHQKILLIKNIDEKNIYLSAEALGEYIFDNKKSKEFKIFSETPKNNFVGLQNVFISFKEKNINSNLNSNSPFPDKFIDKSKDNFGVKLMSFNNKFISFEFVSGKEKKLPTSLMGDFISKDAQILNLLNAFNKIEDTLNSSLLKLDHYNKHNDEELKILKNNITNYILALNNNSKLTIKDKDISDLISIKTIKETKDTVSASVAFSYKGIKVVKTFTGIRNFTGYKILIKPGSENKIADNILLSDIDVSNIPFGVSVSGIALPSESPDGSVVILHYIGGDLYTQKLHGFTSYIDKTWSILEVLKTTDIISVFKKYLVNIPSQLNFSKLKKELLTFLKSSRINTYTINSNSWNKINNTINKVDIQFTPVNKEGEVQVQFKLGSHFWSNPITISGFAKH